ncbi:MAG: hypothetical protein LUB56_01035 [Coprobacillus sp.]|nr:hypothetical protein [Coprobacillus sp.]
MSENIDNKPSKLTLIWKIPYAIIGFIAIIIAVLWGSLNTFKYAIYSEYYSVKEDLGVIPGLNDGPTPQGICYQDDYDTYLFSSYSSNDEPSRVYAKKGEEVREYYLYYEGEAFRGHVGGIASEPTYTYITDDGTLKVVLTEDLMSTSSYDLNIICSIDINNSSDFVFTNGEYLYVGEFYRYNYEWYGNKVVTKENKEYLAICEKYNLEDIDGMIEGTISSISPVEIYALPNCVQGFAVDNKGGIYLSTSYGLGNSHLYYYKESDMYLADPSDVSLKNTELSDIPVYVLYTPTLDLKCPPMFEDLDIVEGKVITLAESASNKYIFGKFFFTQNFISLDVNKLL